MVDFNGGAGGVGGGGGSADLAGMASQTWVDENYLSIEFFSKLFKAYNGQTEVTPNDTETTIDNIKAMFGFWTNQYISALGQNSSGGGGGTLTSIGLVMPTGFSVSPATLTANGSFTVSFTNGYALPTTADVNKGVTAYGWGNHANAGYLTSSDISDMATKTWVGSQGYLKSVTFGDLTSHPTTLSGYGITDALNSSTTFWGQSVSNGAVKGGISNATFIEFSEIAANAGYGGYIDFHFNGSSSDYTSRIIEDVSGRIQFVASNGIRVGDGVLVWDSTNGALKVQRADGTAANFYTTGAVSALGANSGSAGSIANLTITDTLTFINNSENESGSITINVNGLVLSSSTQEICVEGDLIVGNDCYSTYSHADRFYLNSSRYIYLDSGVLKYYNGSTSKTISVY